MAVRAAGGPPARLVVARWCRVVLTHALLSCILSHKHSIYDESNLNTRGMTSKHTDLGCPEYASLFFLKLNLHNLVGYYLEETWDYIVK